jgi:hypothetical protein
MHTPSTNILFVTSTPTAHRRAIDALSKFGMNAITSLHTDADITIVTNRETERPIHALLIDLDQAIGIETWKMLDRMLEEKLPAGFITILPRVTAEDISIDFDERKAFFSFFSLRSTEFAQKMKEFIGAWNKKQAS